MTSIRRALLVPLAGGLAVALVVATVATYLRARDEASAMFDVQLSQLASSVTGMPLSVPPGSIATGSGSAPLVVQVWNRDGVQVYRSEGTREETRDIRGTEVVFPIGPRGKLPDYGVLESEPVRVDVPVVVPAAPRDRK